jgi:SNF2 family DNA or RNA helicase
MLLSLPLLLSHCNIKLLLTLPNISRLGKTLQSITLLYTLLAQGFDGKPMVKRAVIVTPTSLVSNWEAEISKWLKGKVHLLALCESTRADVLSGIGSFLKPLSRLQVFFFPISYSFCSFCTYRHTMLTTSNYNCKLMTMSCDFIYF